MTRRGSILPRLYAAGLVLVLGSALVAFSLTQLYARSREPSGFREVVRLMAVAIADDPSPDAAIARARERLHVSIALYDGEGALLASGGAPLERPSIADGEVRETRRHAWEVGLSRGRTMALVFTPPSPWRHVWVGLLGVLVLIGVAAFLARRWLRRPLLRLGDTASAIADGDLSARTGLRSNDEIGEAGRAFDAMAERVEGLLRSHRELLAGVSHELKTPIARIRVALELAQEATETPSVGAELVGIEADLAELEALVEDVLAAARMDLSKGPSAALPIRLRPGTIAEVVTRAKERFAERSPGRIVGLQIEDDGARSLDPVLLRRAIENLLDNAHKYSPLDAPIRVTVSRDDERTVVSVVDEGFGISPADRARVFTPFFRVDSPEVRASSGLGLGLALAQRIVEAHQGTITLESAPGEGTTVRVSL